jgi:type IV pilus assembly protein PilX
MEFRGHSSRTGQGGAVLFVALVFLLLITVLAVTASSSSVLQERMTGGLRNGQLALMGAETALREGERSARTLAERSIGSAALTFCVDAGTQRPCLYRAEGGVIDAAVAAFKVSPDSCDAKPAVCAIATPISSVTLTAPSGSLLSQPRYVIEWLGYASDATQQRGVMSGAAQRGSQQVCDGSTPKMGLFRVTARSSGGNASTVRVAESVFSAYVTCAYNS